MCTSGQTITSWGYGMLMKIHLWHILGKGKRSESRSRRWKMPQYRIVWWELGSVYGHVTGTTSAKIEH